MKQNERFLQTLKETIPLPPDELQYQLEIHGGSTLDFLEALIEKELVDKERACRMWGDSVGVAYVDPLITVVTQEARDKIPLEIARRAQTVPLYIINRVLSVSMADPMDLDLVRKLERIADMAISPVFAPPKEIHDAIELHYATEQSITDTIAQFERVHGKLLENLTEHNIGELGESQPLAKMLEALIFFAIKERASDIHFEPREDYARVRFRIDGRLHEMFRFTKMILTAFTTRLKVLCKVNIAEFRFPQDGSFTLPLGTGRADFRVSFMPSLYGSKTVLRILASTGKKDFITLDQMLMSQNIIKPFRQVIQNPNGIIFVTGPTGSGKTTTLYAVLQEINTPDKNVSSIEDPVEIRMEGLTQSQINDHIGLSFGILLRALLRQDPDILLIGEIRDLETAKIATEAALTGHLVLSTLHTNSAIQAIPRLTEIGIEPYMVAPSVVAVLAQRLAARVCEQCKESYASTPDLLNRFFHDADGKEVFFYRGKGCPQCRQSGYSGRIAFHELVLVSDEMRSLITKGAGTSQLNRAAKKLGYKPLRYDALKKALLGLTTIKEVEKHTTIEWAG